MSYQCCHNYDSVAIAATVNDNSTYNSPDIASTSIGYYCHIATLPLKHATTIAFIIGEATATAKYRGLLQLIPGPQDLLASAGQEPPAYSHGPGPPSRFWPGTSTSLLLCPETSSLTPGSTGQGPPA
jgi:hypothetical protein